MRQGAKGEKTMKNIMIELTPEQANKLDMYLIMTTNYRQGELKVWKELAETEGEKYPAAKGNYNFWCEMNSFLDGFMEGLRP